MTSHNQKSKALQFSQLHTGPSILVLPNAWDAASARILEQAGFPAIATTSSGVAAALGYPDGEQIIRNMLFGSGMMRATLARLRLIACELLEHGIYTSMTEEMISGAELQSLFQGKTYGRIPYQVLLALDIICFSNPRSHKCTIHQCIDVYMRVRVARR